MKKIQILTWIFAALFLAAACSSGGDEPANPGGSEGGEPQPEANVTSQVYKPGESGYAAFRIPAVVVSKAGTVLAFAEGRVDGSADDGNIDLLVKRSEDNGNTWSTPIKVYDDGENRCQNPAPVVLDNGRILLLFCWNERTPGSANGSGSSGHPRRVMKTYSDDDGKTWSTPEDIHDQVAIAGYTWYATGPCHAIVKTLAPNKGRIVVPCNHNKPGTNPKSERHAHLIYSDDQGATWHLGAVTDHPYGNESTVVEPGRRQPDDQHAQLRTQLAGLPLAGRQPRRRAHLRTGAGNHADRTQQQRLSGQHPALFDQFGGQGQPALLESRSRVEPPQRQHRSAATTAALGRAPSNTFRTTTSTPPIPTSPYWRTRR